MAKQHVDLFERALELLRKNRYWTKREATAVVSRLVESGLSVSVFASAHGIPDKRLRRWAKLLSAPASIVPTNTSSRAEQLLPFVPLRVVPDVVQLSRDEPTSTPIEILLHGGRQVRVVRNFDEETLARVVTMLEALPC